VFDLIRGHGTVANAVHCAFDMLELQAGLYAWQDFEGRRAC
jgi:hypothetical protein